MSIRVFPNVDAYLASLKQEVPAFDVTSVTNRIAETIGEALRSHAEARGFELGALETHKLSAYVTERSNTLALSWTLLYEGFDPSDPTQPDVVGDRVLVRGTSYFDYATNALSEVQTQAIEYRKANGELVAPKSQQTHWLSAAFFGGRGTVRHQFKELVDL